MHLPALLLAAALAAAGAPSPSPSPAGAPTPKPATAPARSAPPPGARPSIDVPLPPPPVIPPRAGDAQAPATGPAAAARPRQALRLAVPDLKVTGDLPPRQGALFEGALLAEVRKVEGVSAIGVGEIREMLSFEYQRQMMGCSADEACLAEIGGALGTDELVQAAVIVEGKTATLTLKRINMRTARVAGSHTQRLTRAGGEELLSAVGPAVQAVFPERGLRAGAIRGVDKEVALRLNPPPLPRWPFFATAGAAAAAVGGAAVLGYLSRDARKQYDALAGRALVEPVPGAELAALERSARSRARSANTLFLVGGGLAVAAGVEAFFTDWHGYRAQVDVGPGAVGVKVGGSFR